MKYDVETNASQYLGLNFNEISNFLNFIYFYFSNNQRQVETKEVVDKLRYEEDKLRREQLEMTSASDDPNADKERMILMQQKKIAALDAANKR